MLTQSDHRPIYVFKIFTFALKSRSTRFHLEAMTQ